MTHKETAFSSVRRIFRTLAAFMPKVLLFISFLAVASASYTYGTISTAIVPPEPLIVTLGGQGKEPLEQVEKATADTIGSPLHRNACLFVASINGSKYYPADCKSAARIKGENIICFEDENAAEKKGYARTTACK